jgi:hypothetical protein
MKREGKFNDRRPRVWEMEDLANRLPSANLLRAELLQNRLELGRGGKLSQKWVAARAPLDDGSHSRPKPSRIFLGPAISRLRREKRQEGDRRIRKVVYTIRTSTG